jgi:hypothetical protein
MMVVVLGHKGTEVDPMLTAAIEVVATTGSGRSPALAAGVIIGRKG